MGEAREVDFQEHFRSKVSEREFTKWSRKGGVKKQQLTGGAIKEERQTTA